MKITNFISLIAATSTFALTIPSKRADVDLSNIDLTNLLSGAEGIATSDECKKATEDYKECFIGTDLIKNDTLDKVCETYSSQKCQDFYKNGLNSIDACKKDNAILLQMSTVMTETIQSNIGVFCIKDEANQYCPYGQFILDLASKSDSITNEEVEKNYNLAVNNSCKSKKCTDAFIEYTDKKNKLLSDVEGLNKTLSKRGEFSTALSVGAEKALEETIKYLKSDECTSQQTKTNAGNAAGAANTTSSDNNNNNTSGAISNKMTGLFVSVALVAVAFLF